MEGDLGGEHQLHRLPLLPARRAWTAGKHQLHLLPLLPARRAWTAGKHQLHLLPLLPTPRDLLARAPARFDQPRPR
jgi:hypothetical protein